MVLISQYEFRQTHTYVLTSLKKDTS